MNDFDQIEAVSRRLIDRYSASQPANALIEVRRRARRRRQRRHLAISLTVAVGLIALLAGSLAVVSRESRSDVTVDAPTTLPSPSTSATPTTQSATPIEAPIIPFAATPGTPNSRLAFAKTLPAPPGSWSACDASELRFEAPTNSIAQSVRGDLYAQNTSRSICALQGKPGISVRAANGQLISSGSRNGSGLSIALVPTSWAYSSLGDLFLSTCAQPATITVELATSSAKLPVGPFPKPQCSSSEITALDVQPFASVPESAGDLADYQLRKTRVTISAPPTVHAGELLHYSVAIVNRDQNVMTLAEPYCPLYEESLGLRTETYQLNCGVEGGISLAPGESRSFAMEFSVSQTAAAGPALLRWKLVEPEGASFDEPITVSP